MNGSCPNGCDRGSHGVYCATGLAQCDVNATFMLVFEKKIGNIVNMTALVKEVHLIRLPNTKSKYSQNSFVYFYCFYFI